MDLLKKLMKNQADGNAFVNKVEENEIARHMLYNHLISGRISLKQYLAFV